MSLTFITLLHRDTVSQVSIRKAELLLEEFVGKNPQVYGNDICTFNLHQLVHVADSVRQNGPLWCQSMAPFESRYNITDQCRSLLLWEEGKHDCWQQFRRHYAFFKSQINLFKVVLLHPGTRLCGPPLRMTVQWYSHINSFFFRNRVMIGAVHGSNNMPLQVAKHLNRINSVSKLRYTMPTLGAWQGPRPETK